MQNKTRYLCSPLTLGKTEMTGKGNDWMWINYGLCTFLEVFKLALSLSGEIRWCFFLYLRMHIFYDPVIPELWYSSRQTPVYMLKKYL